jgi:hypothetical protein
MAISNLKLTGCREAEVRNRHNFGNDICSQGSLIAAEVDFERQHLGRIATMGVRVRDLIIGNAQQPQTANQREINDSLDAISCWKAWKTNGRTGERVQGHGGCTKPKEAEISGALT